MPLDPEALAFLSRLEEAGFRPVHELPVEEARATRDALARLGERPPVARLEERAHGDLSLRIYGGSDEGNASALVFIHGGGWVVGSLDTHDVLCRSLANAFGGRVIAVDYRLAPEHPYPAALEDSYAAAEWAAAEFGGPVAIGGDSAGGNLATAVAMLARERGGPAIAFQLLLYPVADHDFETASYRQHAEGPFLTRTGMRWYFDQYAPSVADRANPLVSPLRSDELAGLPPALVITAEHDVLRDEGEAYAAKLREAGVEAVCIRYQGMFHAFMSYPGELRAARHAIETAGVTLRRALAGGG